MKNYKQFTMLILVFAFIITICGTASATTVSNNNSNITISNSVQSDISNYTEITSTETKSNVTSTNSKTNHSNTLKLGKTQIAPDPQIYKNGVAVARGSHPAGYVYTTISAAITDALAGDTIMLENGATFTERITVTKNLTFSVFNNGNATINGNSAGQIVTINSGLNVIFNNIKFINGAGTGTAAGAIKNSGTLTLNNCIFTNNKATNGGALYNTGTLIINNCTFTSNNATTSGGAIYNTGLLNITNSSFTSNIVPSTNTIDDGGAIYNSNIGTLNITGSNFTSNNAAVGGAILSFNTINVTNCTFTSNNANIVNTGYGGGAIAFGNSGTPAKGILTSNNSTFISNKAGYGGAIWNDGTTIIYNNTFLSNIATTVGGAIRNWGILNVTSSTFIGNTATTNSSVISDYQGNVTINFSRIIGNGSNDIYAENNGAASIVNAQNNWWGSNTGPSPGRATAASGFTINTSPYLVLKVAVSPSTIQIGGTSTVTGDSNMEFE